LITSEFKNEKEYLFAYYASLCMVLRMMFICKDISLVYFTISGFLFFLIVIYCVTGRKKFSVSFILIMTVLPVAIAIDSNLLMIISLMLLFLPLAFINVDITRGQAGFFNFFIPITIIVFCQLIGYRNIMKIIKNLNDNLISSYGLDSFYICNKTILSKDIDEMSIISSIYQGLYSLIYNIS
jgi:hypothetical protein